MEVKNKLDDHNHRYKNLIDFNIFEAEQIAKNVIFSIRPDIVLFCTADNYKDFCTHRLMNDLKKEKIKTVGVLGDDEFNHEQYKFIVPWFDEFVVYVNRFKTYYENCSGKIGHYLPNSCHIEKIRSYDKEIYDTVFIGGPIANRPLVLSALKDQGIH